MKTHAIKWGTHSLIFGKRTCIMGIVNVTPDSFSDGGKYFACDVAVAHGEKLVEDGADIIDIGGESTRPFSESISVEEETKRVIPVIEKLSKRVITPISIDTTKAIVAERAIEAGASIINDTGALNDDPNMAIVAAKYGTPVILMHKKGSPKTMQIAPVYDNLIKEVKQFLEDAINNAEKNGIERSKIIIDPGIGFGKTIEHNFLLIKHLNEFKVLNAPILVGPSRKSFIRNTLDSKQNIDFDSRLVETGAQAVIAASILNGADIVRVHDVAKTRITTKIIEAIMS